MVGMLAPKRCKHGTAFEPMAAGAPLNGAKTQTLGEETLPKRWAGLLDLGFMFACALLEASAMKRVSPIGLVVGLMLGAALLSTLLSAPAQAEDVVVARLAREYDEVAKPLLERYCQACHGKELAEGELDFGEFPTLAQVRGKQQVWLRIREVLDTGDMPPPEGMQPSDAERGRLKQWLSAFFAEEAKAYAGDPGPVALRRLDNSEYTYAVRDLTGVDSLDPAREFPVDGAAGEGFTNVGSGQGMSPALVQKYLDAGKSVARHLVLLPDGVRFSGAETRRDQTDEMLARIRDFYAQYTAAGQAGVLQLQEVRAENQEGGALPLERYLAVLVTQREALKAGVTAREEAARRGGLSGRYLNTLWEVIESPLPETVWSPLDLWRARVRKASADDLPGLVSEISAWQRALWQFNPVGQAGREGGVSKWMTPVTPVVASRTIRFPLPAPGVDGDVHVVVAVSDLGDVLEADKSAGDGARLAGLRIEYPVAGKPPAHPALPLRDVRRVASAVSGLQTRELARTATYLTAVDAFRQRTDGVGAVAQELNLDAALLERWARWTGFGSEGRTIRGLLTNKATRIGGHAQVQGWSGENALSLTTNAANEPAKITTLTLPARSVSVHPSPTHDAVIIWKSPLAGRIRVSGLIADADPNCGNGTVWRVEQRGLRGTAALAGGTLANGATARFAPEAEVPVQVGDLVALVVSAGGGDHVCDSTTLDLTLSEVGGESRKWVVSEELVDRVTEGNPLADLRGNPDVWHICGAAATNATENLVPPGTALAAWKSAVVGGGSAEERKSLAGRVETVVTTTDESALSEPDREFRWLLLDWNGPLGWVEMARSLPAGAVEAGVSPAADERLPGWDESRFGKGLAGEMLPAGDVELVAPVQLDLRLPASLARGGELVFELSAAASAGGETSLQAQVAASREALHVLVPGEPIVVRGESAAQARWVTALRTLGDLFPPAVCYSRIVPVDEVVTLTLYFREDDQLRRLLLSREETATLDRLWDELLFVSQEPLELVVSLEQLIQFATQDRQDLVGPFEKMKGPVAARAEEFRRRLKDVEPAQLESVLMLAPQAWRRPTTEAEVESLRGLYGRLRAAEIAHDEALRLVVARILTAPEFLYKLEQPGSGEESVAVSGSELASRLSFFLWSSLPDEELRAAGESGRLLEREELLKQTRRMLADPRARRLANHFLCQWLHVRDFDQSNDKSETLFPEFAGLKAEMNRETLLFCDDLLRNNGSILDLVSADHTFVNETLARHYGMAWPPANASLAPAGSIEVAPPGWQRVSGMQASGRGGVLGMATVLASQSGASRTSPILRGNWVYETLLGERLPKPPAGVPQLPEAVPEGLTERRMIEMHSSVKACARCHVRIDPFGFTLEQFDPIGRKREQPVETTATLADGRKVEGLAGLRDYLVRERGREIVRQVTRKLIGYALGREVRLSDEPLLDDLNRQLAAKGDKIQTAIEFIVQSRPFREIRGREMEASQ